jgi:hypothetical protein
MSHSPILTPVSELTARLKGPFAMGIADTDSNDGDDDNKENSNDMITNTSQMEKDVITNALSTQIEKDAIVEIKKPKLDVKDVDLTPTSSSETPYVSEAELDALLDNYKNEGVKTGSADVCIEDVDCDVSSTKIEVLDSEIDALLDSGHSSGGEISQSSLVGSIDDLRTSAEIPSTSDSTFSEDIPLPLNFSEDVSQPLHDDVLTHRNCASGARPKVRPGSLQIFTMALPVVSCDSGSSDDALGETRHIRWIPGSG